MMHNFRVFCEKYDWLKIDGHQIHVLHHTDHCVITAAGTTKHDWQSNRKHV